MCRDYIHIADEYANNAASNTDDKYCNAIQAAAKRYLLWRADKRINLDTPQAVRACTFVEACPHPEGRWDTPTIQLLDYQIWILVQLFGFTDKKGLRKFRTLLLLTSRKSGKSTFVAAVLLYCLCCEDEPGAQLITAATTGKQARVIFDYAKKIALASEDLRDTFGVRVYANSITKADVGGRIGPVNARASTQDGLNPSVIAIDEIHAHADRDLYDVLNSARGARSNQLVLITTTEGHPNAGPWGEMRDAALDVLAGKAEDESLLAVLYKIDDGDDPFDPRVWVKANPRIEYDANLLAATADEAKSARAMPSALSSFLTKRVNRVAASGKSYLDLAAWDKCKGELDLDYLKEYECYAGLDLSYTQDISSFRLVWRVDAMYYTWGVRWCPEDRVASRTAHGKESYADWARAGLIRVTPGNVIDYNLVRDDILNLCAQYKVKQIGCDDSNARQLVTELVGAGINVMPLFQRAKLYHPALQALEVAYMSGRVCHGGDPVLRWMLSNVTLRPDAEGRNTIDKSKHKNKIDDAAALLMAVERWITEPAETVSFIDVMYA